MSTRGPRKLPKITDFPPAEATPAVLHLLEFCYQLHEENQALRDEIARLKGTNPKPPIKPSTLEGTEQGTEESKGSHRGKHKRRKTQDLKIHEAILVPPETPPPPGSRFKGFEDFTVQDLHIHVHNTRYRLERWVTPEGETLRGQLPEALGEGHFGSKLRAFVLYQYHHCHITQPLLLEQLREYGIEIAAGELNRLTAEPMAAFHTEKDALLGAALKGSDFVHVDDTGARHRGQNGFCTHLGNALFAFFASTESKSRINFLELLRAGDERYAINDAAQAYLRAAGLPQAPLAKLAALAERAIEGQAAWRATLKRLGIANQRHIRIATEGALLGAAIASGINPELVIVSDNAGKYQCPHPRPVLDSCRARRSQAGRLYRGAARRA